VQDTLPATIAAIDLGSNSFHLILARTTDEGFNVIDREREMVRLAEGLDADRNLSPEVQARALDCLQRFGQLIRELPPGAVRIVGTNTLRSAHNSTAFLRRATKELGHPVEIVSGIEEARLIYLGVAQSIADQGQQRLVVDIGGGSTELIIGKGFQPRLMESLYMGCVSFSRRFFPDGKITRKRIKRAGLAALSELETVETRYRKAGWDSVIGASGTIRAIGKIVALMTENHAGIRASDLETLTELIIDAGHIDNVKIKGLSRERAPVFPGGLVVLKSVFDSLAIEVMSVADGALREGLLYDLLGRIHHEDARTRSVDALMVRYTVDTDQVARVETTAFELFDQIKQAWDLEQHDSQALLSWASGLHEIGMAIAHNQYHKHGAYIISNADLPGFSKQQQVELGLLVRAHRRKFPVAEFDKVNEELRQLLTRLAVLLRIAVVLHRGRRTDPLPEIALSVEANNLRLGFADNWLEKHALTAADLEQEAAYLKAVGYTLEFA
jgi:exopolyphosphatase/guanosine-5'-triphosphate,3'-diphosphate pyrophosphatase